MTPFYTTMALWVGGTLMGLIIYVGISKKVEETIGASPRHAYLGRLAFFLLLGFCQATILLLGDLFLLGVQCENPLLFLLTGWLASRKEISLPETASIPTAAYRQQQYDLLCHLAEYGAFRDALHHDRFVIAEQRINIDTLHAVQQQRNRRIAAVYKIAEDIQIIRICKVNLLDHTPEQRMASVNITHDINQAGFTSLFDRPFAGQV